MQILFKQKTQALKAVAFFALTTLLFGGTIMSPAQAAETAYPKTSPLSSENLKQKPAIEPLAKPSERVIASLKPLSIPVFVYDNAKFKKTNDADFAVQVSLAKESPQDGIIGLPDKLIANQKGTFSFPILDFTKPGTYKLIYRQIPQAEKYVSYDETIIEQTIVIAPQNEAANRFTVSSTYTKAGKKINSPRFENQYSTDIENYRWQTHLIGKLNLTDGQQNQPIPADKFQVKVEASSQNPQVINGSIQSAIINEDPISIGVDGQIDLGKWQFNQPGTYQFTVKQIPANDANIKYDSEPVQLTVQVARPAETPSEATKDDEGYLLVSPQVQISKAGKPATQVEFTNQVTSTNPTPTYVTKVEVQTIPFTTIEENDPETYVGNDTVVAAGVNGKKEVTLKQRYLNGEPVGEPEVVSETIIQKMEPRVIRRGTKPLLLTNEVVSVAVETIPVETVYEDDTTLGSGQVLVLFEGAPGTVEIRTVQNYLGNVPYGELQVVRTIVKPMIPTVIRRGVKIESALKGNNQLLPENALLAKKTEAGIQETELTATGETVEAASSSQLGVYVISKPSIPKAAEAGSTASIEKKKRKQVVIPEKKPANGNKKHKKDVPQLVVATAEAPLVNTGSQIVGLLIVTTVTALGGVTLLTLRLFRKRLPKP
ncbi:G5 domain-containing protein [Gleimia sp. 6138-11-ORH1]|uniref:G5 domain-containing protein n=1 Tax=Gleimia sp. 6138-11-ORH1 TaxID=2973937 RepID=UPI002168FBC3|nr:G5 domain-containing protein [Gleimia sp. 6138-11-ORH1]MCS4485011.1 G5 domain-containing protein [Gleimia sp. 6138-11-ORH1]